MQHILKSSLLLTALAACAVEAPLTDTASSALLTTDDTDLPVECQGIVTYANWASLSEFDSYLPNSVASALVARRATTPFVDLADLSSVSGIAQARLAQIHGRAATFDFVDADCPGVYEELAVSHDDMVAILAYANTATSAELEDVVRFEKHTVVPLIIAARPIATLSQLVDLYGIGPSTFRALRDAAIESPFDELASRVNGVDRDATLDTDFDWFATMYEQPGQPTHLTCFGIASSLVTGLGGEVRPNLADDAEVYERVAGAVSLADRYDEVGDATAGLADLAAQLDGQSFFGCDASYAPDPWSGINRSFYVNTVTGYRVFIETRWSE